MGDTDWGRIGTGIATGGFSELERSGVGPSAVFGGSGKGNGAKGGGAPGAPDFMGLAREQARLSQEATREQTRANRPDQNGPFGNVEWTQDAAGNWTQNTSLAPGLQGTADSLMSSMQNPLDAGAARDQAIDSAYRMQTSRLDPRFEQARAARETQLANEGFSRGDEGWRNAMGEFSRDENDAYQQALLGAQSGAGNTAFGQSLAANMQPYQQLGQIRSLGAPASFTPAGNSDPAQLLSAAMQQYGASMDQYNANQAGKNSKMSGGASMLPLLLMA